MIESDIVALRQHLLGSGDCLGCTAASGISQFGIVRLDVSEVVSRRAVSVTARRNMEPSPAVAVTIETIASISGETEPKINTWRWATSGRWRGHKLRLRCNVVTVAPPFGDGRSQNRAQSSISRRRLAMKSARR